MSRQPAPDPTRPAPTSPPDHVPDAAEVDAVPGDPPVPITVWRTPTDDSGGLLGQPLAARLVAAYTRRGDTIIDATAAPAQPAAPARPASRDPGGDPVLAGAAAAAGRAHRTPPRRGRDEDIGEAALAVCCWPPPRAGLIDPVFTLGGLRRRLRPGGVLAVVVPAPAPGAGPAQLGPAVRAAASAGLVYLQHVVAMRALADGERIVPAPSQTGGGEPDLAPAGGAAHLPAHSPAHTDVLVFTRPGHARG
jgi:hypothetical protein